MRVEQGAVRKHVEPAGQGARRRAGCAASGLKLKHVRRLVCCGKLPAGGVVSLPPTAVGGVSAGCRLPAPTFAQTLQHSNPPSSSSHDWVAGVSKPGADFLLRWAGRLCGSGAMHGSSCCPSVASVPQGVHRESLACKHSRQAQPSAARGVAVANALGEHGTGPLLGRQACCHASSSPRKVQQNQAASEHRHVQLQATDRTWRPSSPRRLGHAWGLAGRGEWLRCRRSRPEAGLAGCMGMCSMARRGRASRWRPAHFLGR